MAAAELFLVNSDPNRPLNAQASGIDASDPAKKSKVTDFVTQQSFASFTASTVVVKGIWKGFQKGFGDWADKLYIVPLALAALFGLVQFGLAMANDESRLRSWSAFVAFLIATTNTLVLWCAAIGVEFAAEEIGVTSESAGS